MDSMLRPAGRKDFIVVMRVKNWLSCCVGFRYFLGSKSSPDEDRLLKYLFDPEYQPNNLKSSPVWNFEETINVTVGIQIRKLIALVKPSNIFKLNYL